MNPLPRKVRFWSTAVSCLILLGSLLQAPGAEGTRKERYLNYPNSIILENATTRVVLCPDAGGRVLEYSWKGTNALFLDPKEKNWTPDGANGRTPMSAGRFDIGPELLIPKRDVLWSGRWEGAITGRLKARLTSQKHEASGVQLVRDFTLARNSSHLVCRQTIRNISDRTVSWCHWSRTFATGNGIVVIPVTEPSKFPRHYVMYEKGHLINFKPEDDNIQLREGYLEITAAPAFPKLGMDSMKGWFAYQTRDHLLFVKRYRTWPDRVYNEVAGLTISIWYPDFMPTVELEPIGPRLTIRPGRSSAFTEEWWLLENEYPAGGRFQDLKAVESKVNRQTRPAR